MMLSAACFAVVAALVRHLSAEHHPVQVAFFRNIFSLLFMVAVFRGAGLSSLRSPQLGMHVLRSLSAIAAMMCWFTALALMPLAEATALSFTSPLFATAGAALILGEAVRLRRWSAVAAGFIGALILLRPGLETVTPAAILALVAAFFIASSGLFVKFLSRRDSPLTIAMFMAVLTTPISLIPALWVWTAPDAETLLWCLLLGAAASGVQLFYANALSLAEISAVLPFDFSRLIFTALAAFMVFGETPDHWTWVGAAVIFSATLYTARREARVSGQETGPVSRTPPDP